MPLFSILIPTRNRSSLLKTSLPTAINQNFQDYEIVVSDNNSSDDTRDFIESQSQIYKKIRYVNPGQDLSMCDHFDFVFRQSRGEYIIYLSDDDALTHNALTIAAQLIEKFPIKLLVWRRGYYQHPDVPEKDLQGRLTYKLSSGGLYEISSHLVLQSFCNFTFGKIYAQYPKMLNGVTHRSVIENCMKVTGGFHLPPFPDHSAACHILSTEDKYHFWDQPIYLCGSSVLSNAGIQYNRKKKFDDYLSLFNHDLLKDVPFPMRYINPSYFFATHKYFHHIYPNIFPAQQDIEAYLCSMFNELYDFITYEDITEELNKLREYMYLHTGDHMIFDGMLAKKKDIATTKKLVSSAKKIANANPVLYDLASQIHRAATGKKSGKSISRSKISTIQDAAKLLGEDLEKQGLVTPSNITRINTLEALEQLG